MTEETCPVCELPALKPHPELGCCTGRPCLKVQMVLAAQGFVKDGPNWLSGLKFYRSVLRVKEQPPN